MSTKTIQVPFNEAEFNPVLTLTKEQYRIFTALGKGHSVATIAATPGHVVSPKTIETHIAYMRSRLSLGGINAIRIYAARYLMWAEHFKCQRVERSSNEITKYTWA